MVSNTSICSIVYNNKDDDDEEEEEEDDRNDDNHDDDNDTLVSLTSILITLPLRSQNLYPK